MKPLIPNRLLFRFEFPLRHPAKPPKIDGDVSEWTDAELLPPLGGMDNEAIFAPVWCCWNEDGITIATRVAGKRSPLRCDPKTFWQGDNLRLMLDMRDTRNIKRATRYCQHFYFLPCGGKDGGPVAAGVPVNRAKENAPPVPPERIPIAANISKTGYTLEAHIPADCLNGFDPEQHRRIGFYYMLEDRDLGRQSFSIGDDLPWHVDPSLWATAVLES